MRNIDLSILSDIPHLTTKVELRIEPLAPLSMARDFPGSFYKTMNEPDKKMLCGLIENILGWHFDRGDRKCIINDIKKRWKKKGMICSNNSIGSTYIPLLIDYFEVYDAIKYDFSEIVFYDDLWSRSYRRSDSCKHINGCRYMDIDMIKKWNTIKTAVEKDQKRGSKMKNVLLDKLFNRYIGSFPQYYSTPTTREYVHLRGLYIVPLLLDNKLFSMLNFALDMNNIGYLGNNEGWINLKLVKI